MVTIRSHSGGFQKLDKFRFVCYTISSKDFLIGIAVRKSFFFIAMLNILNIDEWNRKGGNGEERKGDEREEKKRRKRVNSE